MRERQSGRYVGHPTCLFCEKGTLEILRKDTAIHMVTPSCETLRSTFAPVTFPIEFTKKGGKTEIEGERRTNSREERRK